MAAKDKTETAQSREQIDPAMVKLCEDVSRRWRIILPPGASLVDLNENTELFKWVQSDRNKALSRLDRVEITDHLETWWCDCLVSEANSKTATLVILTKKDLPSRNVQLMQTDEHAIRFAAGNYAVYRIVDGRRISQPTPDYALAVLDLKSLYSRAA